MKRQIEVLFFLDNPEIAVIEIVNGAKDKVADEFQADWFIYNKKEGSVSRFRFISPMRIKLCTGEITGNLIIVNAKGDYRIAIGTDILKFHEKPPQYFKNSALKKIEKYLYYL